MAKKKTSKESLLKIVGNIDVKKWLLASLAVLVAMLILDWLVHAKLLTGLYTKYHRLFLTAAIAKARMPYMLIGQALLSLLLVLVYSQGYSGKGSVMEGVRYGVYIGLLFNLPSAFLSYSWSWFPVVLLTYWAIAMFVQMVIYGAIIGAVYKK